MKKLKQWLIKKVLAVLESEEARKVAIKSSSLLPENIQKNRTIISNFLMEYYKGTIEKQYLEPALKSFFSLQYITEKEKEDILKINMEVFLDIKKDSDFTNDEFDIYREIINYIHSNRQKEVKILLKKAAKKINNQELSISKETIDFITSITDEKLETLKKIFRYVVGNGILKYKNIEQDFMKMGFCQPRSDNIKFLGRIFVNQDAIGGKAYNNKLEAIEIVENIFIWKDLFLLILNKRTTTEEDLKNYLSNEENKNEFKKFLENFSFKYTVLDEEKIKFHLTKLPISTGIIELNLACLAILNDVGVEMYSLLKDEIENYPADYLEAVVKDEKYKNFGLVYETTVQ
ncbi:MAG: hypothetical protein EBT63_02175 [Proteobacteria bacterium]|nr:hypothetical protein [Pseudomonadota bacterium]